MCVHPNNDIPFRLLNPYVQCTRSCPSWVVHHLHSHRICRDSLDFLSGSIITQPIDNKHFSQILRIRIGQNGKKAVSYEARFITGRNKDRNKWVGNRLAHCLYLYMK